MTTSILPETTAPTRERLIAAAIEVFQEHGYDGARVQDIARAAGLTTGAIYANFRGKGDLLVEALSGRARHELDQLMSAAERVDAAGPIDLLRLMGDRLVAPDVGDNRALLLDAVVAARHDSDIAPLVRDAVLERENRLRGVIEDAQKVSAIDPSLSTDALTRYCMMLALGALATRALGLDAPGVREWDELIGRVLAGAAPATHEPSDLPKESV